MIFLLKNINIKNNKSKNILAENKIFDWNNTVCPLVFGIIMKNLKENNQILFLDEIKKQKKKEYFQKNKKIINEKKKQYRIKNRDLHLQQCKKYREKNKERLREYHKNYRKIHGESMYLREQKNKKENSDRVKKYYKEYVKKRILNDVNFKISLTLRRSINKALHNKKIIKSKKTLDLLGCSLQVFKKHIETQFKDGMSWDNHGKFGWHIDHIKPVSSFNLINEDKQKKCFNYKNMQPLWWNENLSKGNKNIW
jgi:hypothetical protein